MLTKQKNSKYNQKGLVPLVLLLILAVVAVGGFFVYKRFGKKLLTVPINITKNPAPPVTLKRRSKPLGVVTDLTLAKKIDPKTRKPLVLASEFSRKDAKKYRGVYVVMTLNKPKPGTKLSYVRYIYGQKRNKYVYLDHKGIGILRPTVQYAYFLYRIRSPQKGTKVGSYLVKIYANGKFEKAITYTVTL